MLFVGVAFYFAACAPAPSRLPKQGTRFKRKECLECHTQFADTYMTMNNVHAVVKEKKCEDCHLRHGIVPKLLLKKEGNQVCFSCHDKTQIGMDQSNVHTGLQRGQCVDCHNPHASNEDNLLKAGIKRASNLITALGSDADNVFLVLLAKGLNPGIYVVARASQNASKRPLNTAGADVVVSPFDIGARRMAHAILRPNVIRFLEYAFADEDTDIHIEEIPVAESSKLVDVALQDSGIRQNYNLIILSIIKPDGDMLFNPSAATIIGAGQKVIAVGTHDSLKRLEKTLNPL